MGYDLVSQSAKPCRPARIPPGLTSAKTAKSARRAPVAEITDRLDPAGWPAGTRVIVGRERPHPGAPL
jgi:hypothetical protein